MRVSVSSHPPVSSCCFILQKYAVACKSQGCTKRNPGATDSLLVSHVSGGSTVLGLPPATFPGSMAGSWTTSRLVRTQHGGLTQSTTVLAPVTPLGLSFPFPLRHRPPSHIPSFTSAMSDFCIALPASITSFAPPDTSLFNLQYTHGEYSGHVPSQNFPGLPTLYGANIINLALRISHG